MATRPPYFLRLASALAALLMLACDRKPQARLTASGPEAGVVVYCSVDAEFARPILQEFEKRTGITVHPVFDTEAGKTTGLVNRIIAERARPRGDAWWSGEIFGTMQLSSAGLLEPYPPRTAADIPERFRDPKGRWTAIGLRGRVIAYDPRKIKPADVPTRWYDVVDPRFKNKFRMADPRFGTTRGHMATLLHLWGPVAFRDYLSKLRANGCQLTDGNSQSVLMLTRGLADIVATDTDDVIAARLGGASIEIIYPDFDSPDGARKVAGTLWIPSSAGLIADAPRPDAGRRLLDYLVSAEVEEKLHKSDSKIVPVRPALREKLKIELPSAASVDYAAAASQLPESDRLVTEVLLK